MKDEYSLFLGRTNGNSASFTGVIVPSSQWIIGIGSPQ